MVRVRVNRESEPADLLKIYPGQQDPQGTFVELDCKSGYLGADYDAEIGNAVPSDVWHGHTIRYAIPLLRGDSANRLLAEIAPLAQRVLDGYESEWNGNNTVGVLDEDAINAEREIREIIDTYDDEDCLHWRDASDWMADVESEIEYRRSQGETVDALYDEYQGNGTDEDRPVIVGLREWLERVNPTTD